MNVRGPWDGFRVDKVSFGGGVAGAVVSICGILTLANGVPVLRWPLLFATVAGLVFGIGLVIYRRRS
jgi:hypothetical protein